jgi:hypothetical protein
VAKITPLEGIVLTTDACFQNTIALKTSISLAPGFGPVWVCRVHRSRFNGFATRTKAA